MINLGTIDQEIIRAIQQANSIAIISHIRPDGDALGSLLGMGLSLEQTGLQVQMVLADGVPASFRHLPGAEKVVRRITGEVDLTAVLDCSDLNRTGGVLEDRPVDINIDHHITNLNFARFNLVLPEAVATSAILASRMPAWGLPVTEAVAKCLLSGLVSDTLGFRTPNVTAQDLRLAADLMDAGAPNLSELYQRALVRRSFEGARYWGCGLSKLQRKGRLVFTTLSLSDREIAGYNGNDDADLINMVQTVEDADITLVLVEQPGGKVKVSWRAQPGFDVSRLALKFGGGGHPAAAGAEINGSLEEAKKIIINASLEALEASQSGNGK